MLLTVNWQEIIFTTIFTSGLTALLSFFIYKKQRRVDFQHEYRKTLLEQRIKAYEKVGAIISKLKEIDLADGGREITGIYTSIIPGKPNEFHNLLIEIYDIWNYSIWISDDILIRIKKIYVDLLYDYLKIVTKSKKKTAMKIGLERTPQIKTAVKELQIILINELLNLHDIDTSLLNKKLSIDKYPP